MKLKILRITTVPGSLNGLLKGQLKFINQYYEVVAASSPYKTLLDTVSKNEGIRVVPVMMTRKITPLKDLKALYRLYKLIKKEKPHIVHTHTPKAGTLGMIASKLAQVPHRLHTVAGLPLLESQGNKRKLLNLVERLTYKCATKVYPNSEGLRKIIVAQKFCKPEKLKVIANGSSNGIDASHYDSSLFSKQSLNGLKKTLGIAEHDFVFVFIGRIVADKGINELINAFEALSHKVTHAKLMLVGIFETELDPLKPETLEIIDKNPNILFVGWQDDVRPYLCVSNALAFPSYREGFPNVVMQAGAMKLPSIVSDINGCNEIITEGVNGFIVPVKNEDRLYKAMYTLTTMDPKDLKNMGEKSRTLMVEKFDQNFVWNAILQEYKKIDNNM